MHYKDFSLFGNAKKISILVFMRRNAVDKCRMPRAIAWYMAFQLLFQCFCGDATDCEDLIFNYKMKFPFTHIFQRNSTKSM